MDSATPEVASGARVIVNSHCCGRGLQGDDKESGALSWRAKN